MKNIENKQTILTDQNITGETDELDPLFHQRDPEDEEIDEEHDDFPSKEDVEDDDDYGLNHDSDDDLSLNIDDEDDLN